jgi:ketosteroid isomerase-like protein
MRVLIGAFVCAIVAFLSGCTASVDVDKERSALLATDSQWMRSAKDADKFASFYAADASFYPAGSPVVKGQAAIRDEYKKLASAPGFGLEWTVTDSQIGAAGDIAYLTGAYKLELAGGGEKGKYVTVWRKQADGAWKVTNDIFNADEPPPPPPPPPPPAPGEHTLLTPAKLSWGTVPPNLPPGAKLAVLSGDPTKAEPFTVRLQMPAGYAIAPHWHPTDEHVTVLSGSFALGMGDTLDKSAATDLPVGGYALLPAQMHHYALAKTAATVQVHAIGPFVVNYVNPADDPSRAKN